MFVKILLVVFLLNGVLSKPAIDINKFTPEVRDLFKKLHNTCVTKTKVPEGIVDKLKKGVFENEDQLKIYIKCVWTDSSVLEGGKINAQMFSDLMPAEYKNVAANTITCFDKFASEKSIEDRLLQTEKCRHDMDPENYTMV